MVRHRQHSVVALGHFNDALQWAHDVNAVLRRRGLTEGRVLVPGFGKVNSLIFEQEFPDHATFRREQEAFLSDAEALAAWRKGTALIAPGTHPWDELEEDAPQRIT